MRPRNHQSLGLDDLLRVAFAHGPPLQDQLVPEILSGAKTSTSGLVLDYERENEPLVGVGQWRNHGMDRAAAHAAAWSKHRSTCARPEGSNTDRAVTQRKARAVTVGEVGSVSQWRSVRTACRPAGTDRVCRVGHVVRCPCRPVGRVRPSRTGIVPALAGLVGPVRNYLK
jgi:hypothetical protein